MPDRHLDVPALSAYGLPDPVPADELADCPVGQLLHRIGDKWTLVVLVLLGARTYRYNELHRAIEGISRRMLTRTLRLLETDGLVDRTVHPTVPPTVEYRLTPSGVTLLDRLSALADWAVEHDAARTGRGTPKPFGPKQARAERLPDFEELAG
ncbi:helix-turn-helix domain-containing protein [Nocardia sp. NPDC050712]|uniref:winged helix-turn-helix transcriptional regulator n=1 Tax=Nocardia sp. NPDC050712 TaxID=3155518 RepID=UPI0033ED6CC1